MLLSISFTPSDYFQQFIALLAHLGLIYSQVNTIVAAAAAAKSNMIHNSTTLESHGVYEI